MNGERKQVLNFIEMVAAMIGRQYAAGWAVAAALAAGVVLPDMPLLRHTYLSFAFVVVLMLWLKLRGETWASFGLVVPRAWVRYLLLGLLLAVVDIVVDGAVRSVTTPLIVKWTGANPHLDAETFAPIKGDLALYLMIVPSVWLFAAFGEEFFYRGYLLTRLAQSFGGGRLALGLAVVVQAVFFALAHAYQGPVGMVPIFVGAIVSGIATTVWGRNLWPAIVAHGLVDTLGFTMLYLGLPLS